MGHKHFILEYAIAALLFAGIGHIVLADGNPSEPSSSDRAAPHLTFVDRRIAANLAIDAQAEIQLLRFAASHAHDPSVKQFAETMAKEFELQAANMDALSGSLASAIWNTKCGEDARPQSPVRMINLERIAMRVKLEVVCSAASFVAAELNLLPAEEFDRSYLRAFILRQIQVLGTLKALERYASPEYAGPLAEATKVVQHGVDQARLIGASLEPARIKSADGAHLTATSAK
ncbi:MAG TPA: hypothetical protein VGZ26_11270 [Pirellulales bacterium]|jgi:predicted outer membrane protein|nr:hypothetical protein [Pirellulales bacterium]